ncbi:MAG: nucleotidyltransferase [Candidatus Binatia bacterium]
MTDTPYNLRDTFLVVVRALSEAGVAYAFIGALPVLAWGRVRATTDIDLVVSATDGWDRVLAALARAGITPQTQIGPADSADSLPDVAVCFSGDAVPVRVDVFIAKTDFERAVVTTAREATVFGTAVNLARPEASIIYKLLAYRRRDVDDIESIFAARQAAGEALDWQFLDSWAAAWGITDRLEPYRPKRQ